MTDGKEMFPLVNEEGVVVGCATRAYCHSGAKPLHPVVHLHIFNSRRLYFRKLEMNISSPMNIRIIPPISAPIAILKQPIAIPVPKCPKNIGSRNINRMPKGIPHSIKRYI